MAAGIVAGNGVRAVVTNKGQAMADFVFQATLYMNYQGQELRNVLHYAHDNSQVFDEEIATASIVGTWIVNLKTQVDDGLSLYQIGWKNVGINDSVELIVPVDPIQFGTNTGNGMATQNSILVQKIANVGTKPNRGRIYLPGFTMNSMSNGLWGSGATGACEAYMNALLQIDVGGVDNARMVIYSPTKSSPTGLVFHTVDQVNAVDIPAIQRRRRRGSGV